MRKNIFDVCWTMYRSNTTFDYINFLYRVRDIKNFRLILLNNKMIKIAIVLFGRILGCDIYRQLFIGLLKDFDRSELIEISAKFYEDFLLDKKIDFTFDIFESISSNEILLCSASLDIIVSHISEKLQVDYVASELEFNGEICTGKLSKDLLGKKDGILNAQNLELVVTDNTSDLKLVMMSPKYVILSTCKNVNFWKRNGFNVDYLLRD